MPVQAKYNPDGRTCKSSIKVEVGSALKFRNALTNAQEAMEQGKVKLAQWYLDHAQSALSAIVLKVGAR